jgi:predicted metal-binding protein
MRRLVICNTCKFSPESKTAPDGRTGGQILLGHMREVLTARPDVELVEQACMWNCTKPCSVVIQDSERFSYITGSNAPNREQAEAILTWFDAHGETPTGEVPFKLWPQAMRGHFIARIPPVAK